MAELQLQLLSRCRHGTQPVHRLYDNFKRKIVITFSRADPERVRLEFERICGEAETKFVLAFQTLTPTRISELNGRSLHVQLYL